MHGPSGCIVCFVKHLRVILTGTTGAGQRAHQWRLEQAGGRRRRHRGQEAARGWQHQCADRERQRGRGEQLRGHLAGQCVRGAGHAQRPRIAGATGALGHVGVGDGQRRHGREFARPAPVAPAGHQQPAQRRVPPCAGVLSVLLALHDSTQCSYRAEAQSGFAGACTGMQPVFLELSIMQG